MSKEGSEDAQVTGNELFQGEVERRSFGGKNPVGVDICDCIFQLLEEVPRQCRGHGASRYTYREVDS